MIRHIVLVRFASGTPESEKASVFKALEELGTVVKQMSGFVAGPNVSPEGLNRGFTHAFTIDFATTEARDAYLAHPAHQQAGARLVQAAEGGVEGSSSSTSPVELSQEQKPA